jgi:hypothetical protein
MFSFGYFFSSRCVLQAYIAFRVRIKQQTLTKKFINHIYHNAVIVMNSTLGEFYNHIFFDVCDFGVDL